MAKLWIKTSNQSTTPDRNLLGGKGAHLAMLKKFGLHVPDFGVLTAEALTLWNQDLEQRSKLLAQIQADLGNPEFYSVRSSASLEDSNDASFAGIFESFLFVRASELSDKVLACLQSLLSARGQEYLKQKNIAQTLSPAVVIQKMIPSTASGVAFSRSPQGNSSLILIEGALGLGEGCVSGLVEVDRYWMDRLKTVVKSEIVEKHSKIDWDPRSLTVCRQPVEELLRKRSLLQPAELSILCEQVLLIENKFQRPMDIEWCFSEGKLWILQARAITQNFPSISYYNDTNLAESYPGLSSPLTIDFVKKMYENVFRETTIALGLSSDRVEALNPTFKTLVRAFGGHLYYHLNSYYSVISSLPGGEKNLRSWHRMVGGAHLRLELPATKPLILSEKLRLFVRLGKFILFHHQTFENFYQNKDLQIHQIRSALSNSTDSRRTAQLLFSTISNEKNWSLTILNDLLVMTSTQALATLLDKNGLPEQYLSSMLRTDKEVDSIRPLQAILLLAQKLQAGPALKELCQRWATAETELTLAEIDRALQQNGHIDFAMMLKKFLEIYGHRSYEELKLESLTFTQNPKALFQLLSWMNPANVPYQVANSSFDIKDLNWIAALKLKLILFFARNSIQAREGSRLRRGLYYAWVREAVLVFAGQLQIENPALFSSYQKQHFFGLSLETLFLWSQGNLSGEGLHEQLEKSKDWAKPSVPYPEIFCHPSDDPTGEKYLPSFLTPKTKQAAATTELGTLSGTAVSSGKVRGRALVLSHPREALGIKDLSNRILITQSTDPAWIFIMSQSKGLISEKGSLLSHTAIIGRELKIPTLVGVHQATLRIENDQEIELNADQGLIRILTGDVQ